MHSFTFERVIRITFHFKVCFLSKTDLGNKQIKNRSWQQTRWKADLQFCHQFPNSGLNKKRTGIISSKALQMFGTYKLSLLVTSDAVLLEYILKHLKHFMAGSTIEMLRKVSSQNVYRSINVQNIPFVKFVGSVR